jgi:hypothetical protein
MQATRQQATHEFYQFANENYRNTKRRIIAGPTTTAIT